MGAALRGLATHRGLLWQFSSRAIHSRHKGSLLGALWVLLTPLLMLALYVFVFGSIMHGRFGEVDWEKPIDHALGIFLGLAIFHFIAEILNGSHVTITSQPNLVKKVVFPLEILPLAQVAAALFHGGITLGLCLLGIVVFGPGLPPTAMWLPVVLLPLVPLAAGLAWSLAAVGVFLRDIGQVVSVASVGLMFASAVFYSIHQISPGAWAWLRWNPFLRVIDLTRDVALWGHAPALPALGYVYLVGFGLGGLGLHLFLKLKPTFADVI